MAAGTPGGPRAAALRCSAHTTANRVHAAADTAATHRRADRAGRTWRKTQSRLPGETSAGPFHLLRPTSPPVPTFPLRAGPHTMQRLADTVFASVLRGEHDDVLAKVRSRAPCDPFGWNRLAPPVPQPPAVTPAAVRMVPLYRVAMRGGGAGLGVRG